MRVLLDTNVLAVAMVQYRKGSTGSLAHIWSQWKTKRFDTIVSTHLLNELDRTLDAGWFQGHLTHDEISEFHADLRANGVFVEILHEVHGVASHWQDDLVLAAAVSGNADYLVTRDKEFRRVGEYQGVKIRTPAEFLQELDDTTT